MDKIITAIIAAITALADSINNHAEAIRENGGAAPAPEKPKGKTGGKSSKAKDEEEEQEDPKPKKNTGKGKPTKNEDKEEEDTGTDEGGDEVTAEDCRVVGGFLVEQGKTAEFKEALDGAKNITVFEDNGGDLAELLAKLEKAAGKTKDEIEALG